MVESHVKDWVAAASANKPEAIVRLDPAANGFGYRQLKARSADVPVPAQLDTVKAFLASVESYRVTLDEVQTEVEGDVGLAWGFYTEEFRHNGRNPEKVRVRFTFTFKYERGDWRTLLYHRDIQKFDEKGAYLPGQ
jgi:ketosteroid isomerase-like protein